MAPPASNYHSSVSLVTLLYCYWRMLLSDWSNHSGERAPGTATSALAIIGWSNTRYEVLCSLAILLEITANLYVHRRGTRYSKRGQARRQQGRAQAARQSARRKKRGSIGCVYTKGRRKYAGKGRCRFKKEAVEAVAPALARGWLRPGLGRSTAMCS
jgi:hypothetical protein